MKPLLIAALALTILGIASYAWVQHDHAVRETALAEARADSLASARQHLLALEVQRNKTDSAVRDSLDMLRHALDTSAVRVGNWKRKADSLVAAGAAPAALAVKDSIIATQDSAIVRLNGMLARVQDRWMAAEAEVESWKTLQGRTQEALDAALKRSRPKFACVGGVGGAAGFGGAAGGLSITCGVPL